jgi:hypothetical protein
MIAFFVKTNTPYMEFDVLQLSQPLIDGTLPDFSLGFYFQGTGHLLKCSLKEEFRLFVKSTIDLVDYW